MLKFGIAGAAALLIGMATSAAADVKAGVDAYQRGDFARALAEWRPLAERGDPDAQFNLAQAYKLGRGVPANLDTAIGYYRKAAVQEHAEAEALLGLLLFQNGKRAEAMPWLAKAAERGDSASQYVYGTALFNGDMVGVDYPRAYGLMTRAAAQGLPPAKSALLEMDKYIPLPQREQGAALAKAAANRPAPATIAAPVRTAGVTPVRVSAMPVPLRPAPKVAMRDEGPPVRPASMPTAKPQPFKTAAITKSVPTTAGGKWRVQLGAFRDAGSANALFANLQKRVPTLASAQPMLVRAGAVTRLQAGPFASRAAATAACARVTAAGQACFAVAS